MTAPPLWDRVEEAARAVRRACGAIPDTALVLGSGLGAFADTLTGAVAVPYAELPHWPVSSVPGHAGRLVVGRAGNGARVAALCGRVHLYEGCDAASVAFATRVMGRLGVTRLVLTNAAGGINLAFRPGTLMVIDDHISLLGVSPLTGPNDERFGPRFPDMTEVYSRHLRDVTDAAASARGLAVAHGVYAALPGPSYETPAEIRYLRTLGADAVGMSTVPEALAARHMGMDVLGISCIANMAAGAGPGRLSHDEVIETTRRTGDAFIALLGGILERL